MQIDTTPIYQSIFEQIPFVIENAVARQVIKVKSPNDKIKNDTHRKSILRNNGNDIQITYFGDDHNFIIEKMSLKNLNWAVSPKIKPSGSAGFCGKE